MNEGEGEADHEAAEVAGLAVGGHAQDGEHEDAGRDKIFDYKGADHGEAGRGGRVVAVAAEPALGHAAEGAALAYDDMADEDEDFDESDDSRSPLAANWGQSPICRISLILTPVPVPQGRASALPRPRHAVGLSYPCIVNH